MAAVAIGVLVVLYQLYQPDELDPAPVEPAPGEAFAFALIGDLPYSQGQFPLLVQLVNAINADTGIEFTIHDGDIKGGGQRCDDAVYVREAERFSTFSSALIYTPGDNEWTDCHRRAAGSYDPAERLEHLRNTFFSDPAKSLGQQPIALETQAGYPENARWQRGEVTFATVHAVGSNNNRPVRSNGPGDEAEFQARNRAGIEWVRSTFANAKSARSAGVLIAMQANIIESDISSPSGFSELATALRKEVTSFGKPVVLVHGDTHFFRIDKPSLASGPPLENLTRVETFGDPQVRWVRASVNPADKEVFSFQPQ